MWFSERERDEEGRGIERGRKISLGRGRRERLEPFSRD